MTHEDRVASVNRDNTRDINRNVSREINHDRNVNIDPNVNIDGDIDVHPPPRPLGRHPFAAAAAMTSAIIGSTACHRAACR